MLEIINRPELHNCSESAAAGETLFFEGDDSRDLYILVSGRLEVLKDDKKLSEITEPGAIVGEMSFLLGGRRTATVRAVAESRIIRVPADRIEGFLRDFPSLAPAITRVLASRLKETTKVMHGFKEFCDQLPDAVIMTDRNRNILAWNRAAEELHGRSWRQMQGQSLAEVYMDPEVYQEFIDDILAGRSLTEKILAVRHPEREEQYVSISTTVLYDGHHNVEGFLFLSRDVTRIKTLEKKYNRIRRWVLPTVAGCLLLVLGLFAALPHYSKGVRILDQRKQAFRDRLAEDNRKLGLSLTGTAGRSTLNGVLAEYFAGGEAGFYCIKGLLVLDGDKKVAAAYSPTAEDDGAGLMGTSYSGITFHGDPEEPYRVLTLFRSDTDNPMGVRGLELAFRLPPEAGDHRWLLFQLDRERLAAEYGLTMEELLEMDFAFSSSGI